MIDAHTHLENGPLSVDYVNQMIQSAYQKGIKELYIQDHTHRFFEFHDMYDDICKIPIQKQWFLKKQKNSIYEYHSLIQEIRNKTYPLQIYLGLEVCYTKKREPFLQKILS